MSSLVGQAAKDDEEFWSHSTWVEEKGDVSDDGSFHESDEESDAKVDVFDSDFDDSEEDEEGQEGIDGQAGDYGEEALLKEERREKRAVSKRKRMDMESHATKLVSRDLRLQQKRNTDLRKRLGQERGVSGDDEVHEEFESAKVPSEGEGIESTSSLKIQENIPLGQKASSRNKRLKFSVSELVGKRSLRTSTINNSIATSAAQVSRQQSQSTGKARHKEKYTQEELLIEAVSKTEPENQRWLLNRKRMQVEEHLHAETIRKLGQLFGGNKKVIAKFHSRRGCFNTITFPEMDHVPEIFTGVPMIPEQRDQMMKQIQKENTCVITGKKARYRDPKTKLGYHDLAAFKELRRRLEAGEELDRIGPMPIDDNVKTVPKSAELQPMQQQTQQDEQNEQNDTTQTVQDKNPNGTVDNAKKISTAVARVASSVLPEKVPSNNVSSQPALDPIPTVNKQKDETVDLPDTSQQLLKTSTKHCVHHKEENGHEIHSLNTFGKCPNSTLPDNGKTHLHKYDTNKPMQEQIKEESKIENFTPANKSNQSPSYNLDNHKLKSCGKPVSVEMTSHSNKSQMPLEQPQHG
jgi:vacuolar protein sorting-associated protein 72